MVSGPFSFPPRRSPHRVPRPAARAGAVARLELERRLKSRGKPPAKKAAAGFAPRPGGFAHGPPPGGGGDCAGLELPDGPEHRGARQPAGIRNGTLFVTVDSSVWLDEIVRYRRREILERLQNSFGRELIRRISFRLG